MDTAARYHIHSSADTGPTLQLSGFPAGDSLINNKTEAMFKHAHTHRYKWCFIQWIQADWVWWRCSSFHLDNINMGRMITAGQWIEQRQQSTTNVHDGEDAAVRVRQRSLCSRLFHPEQVDWMMDAGEPENTRKEGGKEVWTTWRISAPRDDVI